MLKNLLIAILPLSFLFSAERLDVSLDGTQDYTVIQHAINAASQGDTVLVHPGEYFENLTINKEIVLTSQAIYDYIAGNLHEDNWYFYNDALGRYNVFNDYTQYTIINGYNPANYAQESVILVSPTIAAGCISPEIFGFTISDGNGTIVETELEGEVQSSRIGGGILVNNALPTIRFNYIKDCGCDDGGASVRDDECTDSGGAINQSSGVDFGEEVLVESRGLIEQTYFRCDGDVDFTNNMFYNNSAYYGSSIGGDGFSGSIDLTDCFFDVYEEDAEDVSGYWVDLGGDAYYDASGGFGEEDAVSGDVYVNSTNGSNDYNGMSPDSAFQTILYAMKMIFPTENNQIKINLASGTYSPETGEKFPIRPRSYVSIVGANYSGDPTSVINSQGDGGREVIWMAYTVNTTLENLIIRGGTDSDWLYIEHIFGGGVVAYEANDLSIYNSVLDSNIAAFTGGMLALRSENLVLDNVTIRHNKHVSKEHFGPGGAGLVTRSSSVEILNSLIYGNSTRGDMPAGSRYANVVIGGTSQNFQHTTGKARIENTEIRDNDGRGLEVGGNVTIVNSKILGNNNIYAADGSVALGGGLRAGGERLEFYDVIIDGNHSRDEGGGIFFETSDKIVMHNVRITNNSAEVEGGGVRMSTYDGDFRNITIADNYAPEESGISFGRCDNCTWTNTIIWDNDIGNDGWGGNIDNPSYSNILEFDPEFVNPVPYDSSGNYTPLSDLAIGKGDIDNIWYGVNQDGMPVDMGYTGGPFYSIKNFGNALDEEEISFGTVGPLGSTLPLTIINYSKENEILQVGWIDVTGTAFSVNPQSGSIYSGKEKGFNITLSGEAVGNFEETLTVWSDDINNNQGVGLPLSAEIVGDNYISGSLSEYTTNGVLPKGDYIVNGDLFIDDGKVVSIEAGARFYFSKDINFEINGGTLIAIGSPSDSIIFTNIDDDASDFKIENPNSGLNTEFGKLKSDYNCNPCESAGIFKLYNVTNQTALQYVRISKFKQIDLIDAEPIIENASISYITEGTTISASSPRFYNIDYSNSFDSFKITSLSDVIIKDSRFHDNYFTFTIDGTFTQAKFENTLIDNNRGNTIFDVKGYDFNNVNIEFSGCTIVGNIVRQSLILSAIQNTSGITFVNSIVRDNRHFSCASSDASNGYNGCTANVWYEDDPTFELLDNALFTYNYHGYDGGSWNSGSIYLINSNIEDLQGESDYINIGEGCDASECVGAEAGGTETSGGNCCPWGSYCGNYNCASNDYEEYWDSQGYGDGTQYDGPPGWFVSSMPNIDLIVQDCFDHAPGFIDPVNRDYRLKSDSPNLNAGTNYYHKNGEVVLQLSQSDYFGPEPDLGAFQANYDYVCQEETHMSSDGIQKNSCNYEQDPSIANCCEYPDVYCCCKEADCFGDCDGYAHETACGCGYNEAECYDCAGEMVDLLLDQEQLPDSIWKKIHITKIDCAGDCGGLDGVANTGDEADYDDCGECAGGQSPSEPNSNKDCLGICFGETIIDDCGICGGDGGQTYSISHHDGSFELDTDVNSNTYFASEYHTAGYEEQLKGFSWFQNGVGGIYEINVWGEANPQIGDEMQSIWITADSSAWTVFYNSNIPLAGFQFDLIGGDINAAFGGAAEDAGFTINTSSTTVLGFSMTGSTIPPGSGELVKIVPNGPSDVLPFGISNLIFSDAPGNSLDFHYDDGGSLPGDVIFSETSILLNGSSYDGWNYVDLIEHGIILSGKYWVGFKMYSSSRSIGQDLSSEFSENHILSIYKAGADAWQPVGGNLGFNILTEVVGQSICDCDGTVPGDGYCGCNGEVLDCGGVCGGVANVDVCGVCEGDGWSCVPYGDVNKDYNVNVIDLIMMVDYILFPENEDYFLDTNQFAVADVNVDGLINISDIVSIIEFMFDQLGRDINYIEEVTIHKTRKGLELINSGFVTFDINISHENNFNYELTDKALLAMSKNSEYSTRIIISNPEQNTLIETSNDFTVDDIIAVGKNGQYLDVSIILMPTEFVLLPAYPNPFNPSTTFKYGVPIEGPINIAIYNIRGREIVTLYDDLQQVGYHTMVWNASGYASGLYFLKLSSSEATTMKKIMLIK